MNSIQHRNKTLLSVTPPTLVLQGMVRSLLSKNELQIVCALDRASHPLSLPELLKDSNMSYRTLKRLVHKLDKKKVVFTFRDVIKVISLNPALANGG